MTSSAKTPRVVGVKARLTTGSPVARDPHACAACTRHSIHLAALEGWLSTLAKRAARKGDPGPALLGQLAKARGERDARKAEKGQHVAAEHGAAS